MSYTEEIGTVRIVVKNIDELNEKFIDGALKSEVNLLLRAHPRCSAYTYAAIGNRQNQTGQVLRNFVFDLFLIEPTPAFTKRRFAKTIERKLGLKSEHEFNCNEYDWGYASLIDWKEMIKKGFVEQKTITLEADIKVKWSYNLHRKKLFKTFDAADETTNIVLLVEDQQLHVCRELLAVNSPFFKTLFFSDFYERTLKEIPLHDVTAAEFVELLQVLYPPHKTITAENVEVVLKLADRYGMEVLLEKCEFCLNSCSTLSMAKKILLADVYNLKELLCRFLSTLKSLEVVKALRETPEFNQLSAATKFLIVDRGLSFKESK